MDIRKVRLLVKNMELLLESLNLELEDEEEPDQKNIIKISDLVNQVPVPDKVAYYEEDDGGPDILLNNKEEREFYEKFRLGE
jgi:hypothetical protein